MLCAKPFFRGLEEYPCGSCAVCRAKRRRLWTGRLILEASKHGQNCFVTLTYDEDHLPAHGSVSPEALRSFVKRLRRRIEPSRFRFFAVGEYGDATWRPHYHLVLFGVDVLHREVIEASWPFGWVQVADVTPASCAYVAGYCTKKLTAKQLNGRHPEFFRMSNRPGIGASAMEDFARDVIHSYSGAQVLSDSCDVVSTYRVAGRNYPLGRYLRSKLREESGFAESSEPGGAARLRSARFRDEYSYDSLGRAAVRRQHNVISISRARLARQHKVSKDETF